MSERKGSPFENLFLCFWLGVLAGGQFAGCIKDAQQSARIRALEGSANGIGMPSPEESDK